MTARVEHVGRYVLDTVAQRAIDTGSGDQVGVRGLCWLVIPDAVDDQTGEIGDELQVVVNRYGRLSFEHVAEADVATSHPCPRAGARSVVNLCRREMRYQKRSLDSRIVVVLALADAIANGPEPSVIAPGTSLLDQADAVRAADPDLAAAYQRMQDDINARRAARGAPAL